MVNNFVLFQAYGNEGVLAECRFALIQLLQHNNAGSICLVLYTDNESYFTNELALFPNKIIRKISQEEITSWRGPLGFVHRMKIKVLQDFFNSHTGNLLYCDTYTFCMKSLQQVFASINNGQLFMHVNEGYNNDLKWIRFFKKQKTMLAASGFVHPEDVHMANAGVIGMNSTHAYLLDEVLSIADFIFPVFAHHTVEQFAFSYVFQKSVPLHFTGQEIFHYWDLKEYKTFLIHFFQENAGKTLAVQQQLLQNFLPDKIMAEKTAYKNRPVFKKLFTRKWSFNHHYNAK
jgi:hypothetical protein